jgi:hypothetical protein
MSIATNNINSNPVIASTDNSHEYYPSAPAVLIDDGDTPQQPYSFSAVSPCASSDPSFNYASAQVIGRDISPFSTQFAEATTTTVIATPLDPWFKPLTTTTTEVNHDNSTAPNPSSSASNPSSSAQVSVVLQPSYNNIIPAVYLEDPLHKKARRRRRRRVRMMMSGATGFVVGSLFMGPIGAIVGATTGATVARAASKAGERRKDKKVQRQVFRMQQEHLNENYPA